MEQPVLQTELDPETCLDLLSTLVPRCLYRTRRSPRRCLTVTPAPPDSPNQLPPSPDLTLALLLCHERRSVLRAAVSPSSSAPAVSSGLLMTSHGSSGPLMRTSRVMIRRMF
eukprot:366020-Rhodomonas_salina.1